MGDKQPTTEEKLQSALEDFVLIAGKLKGFCNSIDEMIEMAELGTKNNAQLRLIVSIVAPGKR